MHQDVGSVCLIYNKVWVRSRARNRSVSIPQLLQMAWFCLPFIWGKWFVSKVPDLLAKTSKTNAWTFSLKVEFFKHFFKGWKADMHEALYVKILHYNITTEQKVHQHKINQVRKCTQRDRVSSENIREVLGIHKKCCAHTPGCWGGAGRCEDDDSFLRILLTKL